MGNRLNHVCRAVSLKGKLPAFVADELDGYCKDIGHGLTLDLDLVRPETQLLIANTLRDMFDQPILTLDLDRRARTIDPRSDLGFGVPILGAGKLLGLPIGKLGLSNKVDLTIWATNLTEPSKTNVTG